MFTGSTADWYTTVYMRSGHDVLVFRGLSDAVYGLFIDAMTEAV